MVDFIEATEVKATVIAELQSLSLSDAPLHQGVIKFLTPPRLVCRDADILLELVLAFEPVQLLGDKVRFELAGTPARLNARPAIAFQRLPHGEAAVYR